MPSYTQSNALSEQSAALQELAGIRPSIEGRALPLIERLRTIVPFDDFAFSGLDIEGCHVGQGIYLATSLPQEFRDIYTRERLIKVDPLAKQIRQDQPIARWDAVSSEDLNSASAQRLTSVMKHYGVAPRTGITLWNKGRSYGAAMFLRQRPFTDSELMALDTFGPALHTLLAKPVIEAVNQRLGLSKGEIQCLKLASDGLTSEDIAKDTPFTVETVTTYLKSAMKKLRAKNRSHAVSEAIRRKIIQ